MYASKKQATPEGRHLVFTAITKAFEFLEAYMRKRIFAAVACVFAVLLTGCAMGPHLTNEQNNIIAEYAADILLGRSYFYIDKYEDITKYYNSDVLETESQPATEEPDTDTPTSPDTSHDTDDPTKETTETETTQDPDEVFDLAEVLVFAPLQEEYTGYRIVSEYPDDPDALFSFTPEDGYKFIVVEFDVYNPTDKTITLNTENQNRVFKATVNKGRCNNYANLLLNDFSRLRDVEIEGQSHYESVIIFMADEDVIQEIDRFEISIKDDEGHTRVLKIK